MSETDHTRLLSRLNTERLPRHVAIILDGNGRWAKSRGMSRSDGHRAGAEAVDRLLEFYLELKIPYISMYAFSTENWKRPVEEVTAIWRLLNDFFLKRLDFCREKGIRIRTSGNINRLPPDSRSIIKKAYEETKQGETFTANFCVNYGSQDEILNAINRIVQKRLRHLLRWRVRSALGPVKLSELEENLYTHPLPPVDLVIRPGGESRISNFLLWQSAYAEIYVTDVLWPDFDEEHLTEALEWFSSRDRRFGGLSDEEKT